ncbi:glycoside hydrolase family 28 protein [Microbacter margulisiae]|uniref:Polygalacturonase n=1 Tax=Microbacter margulisiae TaxID=1350067 RepID=A0A7W5DSU8_9PORP|nr:glycoside hydrolase family 28 protein [Microbacter margulisiae]MBB3187959.1 polygalacturonase [Microbacter margulisiae]
MKKQFFAVLFTAFTFVATAQTAPALPADLYVNLPFVMPQVTKPVFPANVVSITTFGGKGDGKFDNTTAFAEAINAIVAKGGGTVEIPQGTWLTGPIVLKSNVCLHTEKGTTVLFSADLNHYPLIFGNFEGVNTYRCQSPISAYHAHNIAITGSGVFDGSGQAWRPLKKSKAPLSFWEQQVASGGVVDKSTKTWWPSEGALKGSRLSTDQNVPDVSDMKTWKAIKDYLRPVMIEFDSCQNVFLEGITIQNSPAWTIHPLMCQNVLLNGLTVRNPEYGQNTDGIDIESSKNVVLVNSSFSVGDDGICVKSGKNESGRKRGMPTENLLVENCIVYHAHGGFVIGSEMSGGVLNVKVSHCNFIGTDAGLRFKSTRGRGGVVKNIYISDINMSDIKTDAILFNMFYGGKTNDKVVKADITTPVFHSIFMKDIVCNGAKRALFLNGLPEMYLRDITLTNAQLTADEGGSIRESSNITLTNVSITTSSKPSLELENTQFVTFDHLLFPDDNHPVVALKGSDCQYVLIKNSPELSYSNITWSDHATKDAIEVRP